MTRQSGKRSSLWAAGSVWLLTLVLSGEMVTPGDAYGGGLRDLEDGWLIPLPLVDGLLRSALPVDREEVPSQGGWMSVGQARLYGMVELPMYRLALGSTAGPLSFSAAWQSLGNDLYREEQYRLRFVVGRHWRLTLGGGAERVRLATEPVRFHVSAELGLMSPAHDRVVFQAAWPLLSPALWHGGRRQRRWLCLAGRLDGARWALALDRNGKGTPALQADYLVRVDAGLALGLRAEPSTGSVGFTSVWRWSSWLLRTSHVAHPALGLTHRWSLTWGVLGGIW